MKTVGLITEYNPFHNGHLHHLQESLKHADADVSVAVMSGHFMQRGEPALVDKWCRAQMALAAGVDVVIELPLPWACSSAPDFASGGVEALHALGGIEALGFGSESGNLHQLQLYADTLNKHFKTIEIKTKQLLKQGRSYPQARAQIFAGLLPADVDHQLLNSPNNILGIEYLKVILQRGWTLEPVTFQRLGAGYHDRSVNQGEVASATGIRHCLEGGGAVEEFVPARAMTVLHEALARGNSFCPEQYFMLLLAQIFRDADCLKDVWLVENGLENRLLTAADRVRDLDGLMTAVKSRQMTRTRIQRMLVAVLLGVSRADVMGLFAAGPRYLHLLAVSRKGQEFLGASRKARELPLIQNFSRVYASLKRFYGADSAAYRLALKQLDLELKATRIYTLLMKQSRQQQRNRDFYQPLLRQEAGDR